MPALHVHPARDRADWAPPPVAPLGTSCCTCPLRQACSPCALAGIDPQHRQRLMFSRRSLRAGESLYRKGEAFEFIHAVRSGTLKSCITMANGLAQVSGFHFSGDVVGLDGLAEGRHETSATALEDTQICAVAYGPLLELSVSLPSVQRDLHRLMSHEIAAAQWHMLLLGNMTAPERLAAFLLDLSRRAAARGYSASEFNLRMTRSEIGSYLGMTLETVCRTLMVFKAMNLLEVDTRHIRFVDLPAFVRMYGASAH